MTSPAVLPALSSAPLQLAITTPSGPPVIVKVAAFASPETASVVVHEALGTCPGRYAPPSVGPTNVTTGAVPSTEYWTVTSLEAFPALSTAPLQVAVSGPSGPPLTVRAAGVAMPDSASVVVHVVLGTLPGR